MRRKDLRAFNHYLNSRLASYGEPIIVNGQMGDRDRNTGKYRTILNNQGALPTQYIGLSNSRQQGYNTEIDITGWSDS